MTALDQYQRLEAQALFYPETRSQRRDVVLSIGDASLTITDLRSNVLAHWSLAALERVNPGRRPAIYAPAPDAAERIEIEDETMIRALEKVRGAVARGRPRKGRVRVRLVLAACLAVCAAAVFWLPGALVAYTASVVPDAARVALGDTLLERIVVVAGQPCDDPAGVAAMRRLVRNLAPSGPRRARVLPGGVRDTVHLPGGTVLLSRAVVEDHEVPQVVAGYLLAETQRAADRDPLAALLEHAGLAATLTLMTTGRLPEDALSGYAEALLTEPAAEPDHDGLIARFGAAGVPITPYAYARDVTGEATLALIEADPMDAGASRALLTDGDWVALQGICGP